MKFVSDCLTGKDNLSSDQIVKFPHAAWTKSPLARPKNRLRFH